MKSPEDLLESGSLKIYLDALKAFDTAFCNAMVSHTDFTLKIEIHGDKGRVLHIRNSDDVFRRPPKKAKNGS